MKTTFTLPQAIGLAVNKVLNFKTNSTPKIVSLAIIAFAIFAVIVLKFGNTIN